MAAYLFGGDRSMTLHGLIDASKLRPDPDRPIALSPEYRQKVFDEPEVSVVFTASSALQADLELRYGSPAAAPADEQEKLKKLYKEGQLAYQRWHRY